MTIEELAKKLESTGFPVAFYQFPKEEPHEPPFICYITPETNNYFADGKVYFTQQMVQVELYTRRKKVLAEKKLERVLQEFAFTKDEGALPDEKLYLVTYQFYI